VTGREVRYARIKRPDADEAADASRVDFGALLRSLRSRLGVSDA
jgi:hypothetical protein